MGAAVRLLAVGRKQTAVIERISDGARMVTSVRALRRIKMFDLTGYEHFFFREKDGGIVIGVREFPGCLTQGKDLVEAMGNIQEAADLWVERQLAMGRTIPLPCRMGDDRRQGLYRKYVVTRIGGTPGKHNNCLFFVLDAEHDKFSLAALDVYADECESEYPVLAFDLRRIVADRRRAMPVETN
jgi:predicted RNase H-like HicB family nuclease